ncbi:hypothetical protein N3K66_002739 [Trichothecium roseum]|uniref:Uncharacterized protein n=1 Tax=Trichothecium roseum TaxID=47278 RepID=A0ACC0VAD1_9HYPO|nr:hypothetical protein N3K66_002739 [Trichothecium roseum]
MDHADHTMPMDPTSTSSSDAAQTTTAAGGAMDHSDGMMSGGCKISMLINYNTVGACFISEDWRITSTAMFAGSCVGVVCLSVLLELLRRAVKEWDRRLVRNHVALFRTSSPSSSPASSASSGGGVKGDPAAGAAAARCPAAVATPAIPPFRPKLWQQVIRSFLHTAQFTVAYFIMLLAMYYNVYILVSIFLGILIGNLLLGYETLYPGTQGTSENEPTVCCG